MGDRNLEREPEYNFESAFRPDQFMGSISHAKETKIFTLELPTAIAKSSYRSLVDSSIGQVEPEQIIKNILVQTGIVAPNSEAQRCANKYIDDVSHQYRQYFFDDINGKITKNVEESGKYFSNRSKFNDPNDARVKAAGVTYDPATGVLHMKNPNDPQVKEVMKDFDTKKFMTPIVEKPKEQPKPAEPPKPTQPNTKEFINNFKKRNIPMVLETPSDNIDYKIQIDLLKNIIV